MRLVSCAWSGIIVALLCACAQSGPLYPEGWIHSGSLAQGDWKNPADNRETYSLSRKAAASATIKDLASQVTIDVILRNHGAKLVKADLFEPCPGSAGLQIFSLPDARQMQVAFAVWNSEEIEASFQGPGNAAVPNEVTGAMTRAVCSPS